MKYELKPIGCVHSILKNLEDCPRQEHEDAPVSTIEIFDGFLEGIQDIQAGDAMIIFTWLDKSDRAELSTRPRNDPHAPVTGVFSTRSPNRPNPIGMHHVDIVSISGNQIRVSALEVLDQTPVIDIKPDMK